MVHAHELLPFILAVLTLFVIPGPAVMLILTQSLSQGRAAGVATAVGLALGDAVHASAAALGLTALLASSAALFAAVKWLGVLYLLFLAVQAWRDRTPLALPYATPKASRSPGRNVSKAALTEILNPKTALFFLSFLPQFVRPEQGAVLPQMLILGGVFVLLSLVYSAGLALAAGGLSGWLRSRPAVLRWQGKVVAGVYVALGLRLALQSRD
ncbi:LysE family translocator (plasmid) [Deinococcus metallilatus]|uniref:LysE family translocator n=1 Tax=Deinococcus metallilatus TaxID=1211322 RepID=A0AAJ5JZQ1_9DEIO|nr:LysE family translocator [Deinococcus metallilatus]MBB5297287.1 threonine/homoserine/homoserine lactone efflux protein [Deinococcus metallilatus]QBY06967.1 LysE family translocator [Deinococcus metallilatus]TLK31914.1 LysE family translocator [Deinococcus metallilatus]GMA17149.1 lysine transporter LysE [Deinococcus metallilatus]